MKVGAMSACAGMIVSAYAGVVTRAVRPAPLVCMPAAARSWLALWREP